MGLLLISQVGDFNTHGGGALIPATPKVFINNFAACSIGTPASPDSLCDPTHRPLDCAPVAIGGSTKVFIGGTGIHREGDLRVCGATTMKPTKQPIPKVFFTNI